MPAGSAKHIEGRFCFMEYNGFISTLIDRSEMLLMPGEHDDLNVTRLLLVMNTGFALVRDRMRYWDDTGDNRLSTPNPWKWVQKACKSKLGKPVTVEQKQFFEDFRTSRDWVFLRVPKECQHGALSGQNVVQSLKHAEEIPIDELKLDAVIWALRNAFAHGGILPMSPSQAGSRLCKSSRIRRSRASEPNQIDRVYFISYWTGNSAQDVRGWIVMEFGLDALHAFWNDWRTLLLNSGHQALHQLDRVA